LAALLAKLFRLLVFRLFSQKNGDRLTLLKDMSISTQNLLKIR